MSLSATVRGDQAWFAVAASCGEAFDARSAFDLHGRSGRRGRGSRLGMYVAGRLVEAAGGRVEAARDGSNGVLGFGLSLESGVRR